MVRFAQILAAELAHLRRTDMGRYVNLYIATPMHSLKLCTPRMDRAAANPAVPGIGRSSSVKNCA